ncbi:MAG: D-alanine--D-alanine ligase, partial [bacterium]
GISRTDMIVTDYDLIVLETNTLPGMTNTSLVPLCARVVGISFSELMDILIDDARGIQHG